MNGAKDSGAMEVDVSHARAARRGVREEERVRWPSVYVKGTVHTPSVRRIPTGLASSKAMTPVPAAESVYVRHPAAARA